ncbi:HNH endonuclease [Actinokineospora alba]|uniref:HNH endonuclease n=1 Tax=Actinokineospora alba TaxID=504798 RepID=A0A1H0JLM7_9PSEU|nr:HNH endonuclease [Actinokineospora alba]SDH95074.1 HNH endonuclease [Actinokineospora alba]SDO44626.1 HNH endonuclease [Actinokineospora alba]
MTSNGYRLIRLKAGGWVLEHRHIMELKLGRPLLPGENVHHLNGDRVDNRPENLELWVTRQPRGQRVEDALAWAHEIIARYGSVS